MSEIETELVKKCIKGDLLSQKKLYELFAASMFVVCCRYAKDRMEAEDILQEAFMKVFAKIDTFKAEGPLGAWIRRIVVNTALNYIQRTNTLDITSDINDHILENAETDTPIDNKYDFKELLRMIEKLAPRYRLVFNMCAIDGYSHKEIARELGISEGTSKSQYSRARALLMEMINNNEKIHSHGNSIR